MPSDSTFLAKLRGDYVKAGDLYYRKGKIASAAEMYAKAGNHEQAARIYVELGDHEKAVDFYVKSGNALKAGELLVAVGDLKEAIPLFERAKAFWQAAECSAKLKQPRRAARFYERAGAFEEAARCYEQAGDVEELLRVMDRQANRLQGEESASGDDTMVRHRRGVDARRAEMLARLGRYEDAAALLAKWGRMAQAGQLLERAGKFSEAAEAYMKADEPLRALALLEQATDLDQQTRAVILRQSGRNKEAGEIYEKLGLADEAAQAFEAAGDWGRAAALLEESDSLLRAADLFFLANSLEDAGRCFAKAQRFRQAAETYAKVNDHAAAADCFLKAEEFYSAASHFLKAGDKSAASKALQAVPRDDPDFENATLALVPLLVEEGLYDGALHRLGLLPDDTKSTSGGAVERLYWEGRAFEATGRFEEAESCYQKALALRHDHRDLTDRLRDIRQRKSLTTQKVETATSSSSSQPVLLVDSGKFSGFSPGSVLADRYEILGELGRGGMSTVFKARDRELNETVAIKTLLTTNGTTDEERLLREVQICRRITHANVVRVYDMGRFPGGIFVTMELLEGVTLDKLIAEKSQFALERTKSLLKEIVAGLVEAHELKVIHRDLKPANIFLTRNRLKIMDFGIARMEETDVRLTQTGQAIGSPLYMSPEQIQGKKLDARSDLYSLGVLTYALLAGREPFIANTPTAVALKHVQEIPPDIRRFRSDLPEDWERFVYKLLAKSPADRYQTAKEVSETLDVLPV